MARRVVVTGLGLICGVGNTTDEVWSNLLAGKSGVARITEFNDDIEKYACKIAAQVKNFDPLNFVEKKEAKKMARFIHLALAAAHEAMTSSGLQVTDDISELTARYTYGTWRAQRGWKPMHVTRAEGCYFWDAAGKRYFEQACASCHFHAGADPHQQRIADEVA